MSSLSKTTSTMASKFMFSLSPRVTGEWMASHAKHITIDDCGVEKCAKFLLDRILSGKIRLESLFQKDGIHRKAVDDENFGANYVFFISTLNFSFWTPEEGPKWQVEYNGSLHTGYMGLVAAVNKALDNGVNLTDPHYYADITEDKLNRFLMGEGSIPCALVGERVRCLREVADVLKSKFSGSVPVMIKKAENSADRLLDIVTDNFPCFRDNAMMGEGQTRVSFHKRAQIFIADLWGMNEGKGIGRFEDIEALTMFADYRVPQSLQYFGALKYSDELLSELRKNEVMASGCQFEVEIRGCSIRAVDLVVKKIKTMDADCKVNAVLVDYFLWGFRRELAEEMKKFPFHKTRSVFY